MNILIEKQSVKAIELQFHFGCWMQVYGYIIHDFYQTFFTAFEWTATALPEGSSIFSNSLLHRNATGEEQAIDGSASTVKAASLDENIASKISR